jgi:hypothetical protein
MRTTADIGRVCFETTEVPDHPRPRPSAWDDAPEPMPDWDLLQQPESDFEFDQRIAW